ncbi:MAG: agmatine deiminase family protein [Cyanobacteria bacterium J06555_13]
MSKAVLDLIVPHEEGPHERTFMQWPVNREIYRERAFLTLLQQAIADIANTISEFEVVTLLAAKKYHSQVRTMVSDAVEIWDISTDDLWCRDSGPLFAKKPDGKLAISHLQFNGWGEKQVHHCDGQIAARIAERLSLPLISSGLRGEGGGVEHDGHGLLMAHESSWVNKNRNRGMSRDEIEKRLLAAYGAERMIWSPGVEGEDITDYHIDSLARFTGPGKVLINLPDKPDMTDPLHIAALETYDNLVAAELDIEVVPEPERPRVTSIDFVASYANYYACNGGIVAAQFGDREADEIARTALAENYAGREVVMLNVDALGEVGGGIHCATQQMPA